MDNLNSRLKKQVSDLVLIQLDTQLDGICHQLKTSEDVNGTGIQISISSDQIQEIVSELKKQLKTENYVEKRQKVAAEEEEGERESQEEEMDIEDDDELSTGLMAELKRKVVENSLILKCILSKLRTDDVLNCRLVCSSWDETATLVLIKRKNKLIFQTKWNHQKSRWNFYRLRGCAWRTLDMLTMLLRSSKRFPSLVFEFHGGNFKSQDILRFFNLPFCNSITSLRITPQFVSDPEDREIEAEGSQFNLRDVGKILIEKLPNLETFEICLPFTSTWSGFKTSFFPPNENGKEAEAESSTATSNCLLPALKNLSINPSDFGDKVVEIPMIKELLTVAPNLKRLNTSCLPHGLEILLSMKKENLIKSIKFTPSDQNLDFWDKFLSWKLQLDEIHIDTTSIYNKPELWKKVAGILSQLLKQNAESLINLRINGTLSFLAELSLPVFKNLEYLNLSLLKQFSQPQPYSIFSKPLSLAETFPLVSSVEIYTEQVHFAGVVGEKSQWSKFLGFQETFLTVTKLRMCVNIDTEPVPLSWCQELGVMFPNTKDLELDRLSDFPSVAPILWRNFNKIKCLKLCFLIDLPENVYPALDCGFSGLSVSQHEEMEQSDMEFSPKLSENLSILELKDLEELHITLDFYFEPEELTKPMSTVAAQIFKMMSQLKKIKVIVGDQYVTEATGKQIFDSLEPLKDYGIKIISWKSI